MASSCGTTSHAPSSHSSGPAILRTASSTSSCGTSALSSELARHTIKAFNAEDLGPVDETDGCEGIQLGGAFKARLTAGMLKRYGAACGSACEAILNRSKWQCERVTGGESES
jgi:hypothetical protein